MCDLKFEEATPFTLHQYWYCCGAAKQVQKWLSILSSISLVMLLSPALFLFAPAKKVCSVMRGLLSLAESRRRIYAGKKALSALSMQTYLISYISIASDNTRVDMIISLRSHLECWMNPFVDAATSANDFDFCNVRKKRMTIYLVLTRDNLDRIASMLNLFFQQLIDLNTRELLERNKRVSLSLAALFDIPLVDFETCQHLIGGNDAQVNITVLQKADVQTVTVEQPVLGLAANRS